MADIQLPQGGSRHHAACMEAWLQELLRITNNQPESMQDADRKELCAKTLRDFHAEMRQVETNDRYYRSYALDAQAGMLGDSVRTKAFQEAINEVCKAGDVVLDVGCGSGVLSAFAAKAGAGRVIAVEANATAAEAARAVMSANGLQSKVLVLQGCIEDVAEAVDKEIERCGGKLHLLVSEWIGFGLIHEGMFASVAFARDRWRPSAVMPSSGSVSVSPCSIDNYPQSIVERWTHDLYGLDFAPVAAMALRECTTQPLSTDLQTQSLLAGGQEVWRLDCTAASADEASTAAAVELEFEVTQRGALHGLCMYFDLQLSPGVKLSTAPGCPSTHWKQLIVLFHAKDGARPFPTVWPGDHVQTTLGFCLRNQRFLQVTAKGQGVPRGGHWQPWTFDQQWVVSPDPLVEPVEASH